MGRKVWRSWLTHSPLWGKVQEVGILVGGDDEALIKAKKDDVSRKRKTDDGETATVCCAFCLPLLVAPKTLYTLSYGNYNKIL